MRTPEREEPRPAGAGEGTINDDLDGLDLTLGREEIKVAPTTFDQAQALAARVKAKRDADRSSKAHAPRFPSSTRSAVGMAAYNEWRRDQRREEAAAEGRTVRDYKPRSYLHDLTPEQLADYRREQARIRQQNRRAREKGLEIANTAPVLDSATAAALASKPPQKAAITSHECVMRMLLNHNREQQEAARRLWSDAT